MRSSTSDYFRFFLRALAFFTVLRFVAAFLRFFTAIALGERNKTGSHCRNNAQDVK